MTETYFLDVNVLMYAAGQDHPYKQPCLRVLAAVEAGLLSVAVDAEIIQELLYRYSNIGLTKQGVQLAFDLLAYHPSILPLGAPEIGLALEIFSQHHSQGVRPRDAFHAAAMLSNGLHRIISADRDFDHIQGIARLDPHDL